MSGKRYAEEFKIEAVKESGGVYGYRKITDDLRDLGERCGKHRVYRLMRDEGLAPRLAIAGD
jgi:transposase InsO family protein